MKASKRVRRGNSDSSAISSEHEPRQIEFVLFTGNTKYVGDLKEDESSNKNREM